MGSLRGGRFGGFSRCSCLWPWELQEERGGGVGAGVGAAGPGLCPSEPPVKSGSGRGEQRQAAGFWKLGPKGRCSGSLSVLTFTSVACD